MRYTVKVSPARTWGTGIGWANQPIGFGRSTILTPSQNTLQAMLQGNGAQQPGLLNGLGQVVTSNFVPRGTVIFVGDEPHLAPGLGGGTLGGSIARDLDGNILGVLGLGGLF